MDFDIDFEIDYSSTVKPKKRQTNIKKDNYTFQSRFIFNSDVVKFKSVNKIEDIKICDLPDTNCCLKIAVKKNTISSRLLKLLDISKMDVMLAVISEEGIDYFKNINIPNIIARSSGEDLMSPLIENINTNIKKRKNHIKIFAIETVNKEKYVITSSANPKPSAEIECYSIDNNKEYYNYIINTIKAL